MYSVENIGVFFYDCMGQGGGGLYTMKEFALKKKEKEKYFAASTKSLGAAWGLCVTQRVGSLPIFLSDIYLRYVLYVQQLV